MLSYMYSPFIVVFIYMAFKNYADVIIWRIAAKHNSFLHMDRPEMKGKSQDEDKREREKGLPCCHVTE